MVRLRHKKIIVVVLITIISALFLPPAGVYADDPESEAFPPMDDLFGGRNSNPYLTVYYNNYHLDMKDVTIVNLGDTGGWTLNCLANLIFGLQKVIGRVIIILFYWAFELDIYKIFENVLNNFVESMKTSLFDQMATLCIALLGIFFAVKLVQDQKTQIWVAIFQTVIISAIAIYFFTNPTGALQQVDKASKEISRVILTGTYKATNDGATPDSAVIAAANQIWYIYVHQPWQMLEFGNISMAKQYEKQLLTLPPGSDERKALVKELAKDKKYFTADWGLKRLGFELLYLVPLLIVLIVIVILCALMIIYQFLTVFVVMFGVFVFIMALIPFFGMRVIQNWASKIIGFAGIKIIVTFCLGILMAFITTLSEQSQGYGWIMTIFLEVAVTLGIFWKKDAIFEAFTNLRLAPANPAVFNKQLRRDYNAEPGTNEISTKAVKGVGKLGVRAFKRVFGKRDGEEDETGETGEEISGNPVKDLRTGPGNGSYDVRDSKPSSKYITARSVQEDNELYSSSGLQSGLREEKANENENFRQLLKKAEEILEQQYEYQKTVAEEKAEKMKKEPEYTAFVNMVDTREKLGAPRFDRREIISVAQELDRVVKAGGNPEDLIKRDGRDVPETGKQAANPSSVMEIVINGQKETVDREEAYKIVEQNAAEEYTKEFNQEYKKSYGPGFMEGIIKKYGMQNTREILDRMKEIQGRGGGIKNPAGYLVQSLKNNLKDKSLQSPLQSHKGEDEIESTG